MKVGGTMADNNLGNARAFRFQLYDILDFR
jgi:hypothetical protein